MTKRRSLKRLLGKAVVVAWTDACLDEGWQMRDKVSTAAECETLGWLLAFDRKVVNIAQSRSDQKSTSEVMVIPRAGVKTIRRVR